MELSDDNLDVPLSESFAAELLRAVLWAFVFAECLVIFGVR